MPTVTRNLPEAALSASHELSLAVRSPEPTIEMQPAIETARAFIQAIGDPDLVKSYMIPARRGGEGVYVPPLPAHEIQNVQCVPSSVPLLAPGEVVVWCSWTYRENWDDEPAGGAGSEYVWLTPEPNGTWLVYDYGN
jgi:hypothetical protein